MEHFFRFLFQHHIDPQQDRATINHMDSNLSAEDLDRYVELVDHEMYARQGIVIHAGAFPDDNAPHGMNDEEEMI
jgi:hypothetical protein